MSKPIKEATAPEPEVKILPPEAVEAAAGAVDEAAARAEAAEDFPGKDEILVNINQVKEMLNGILKEIKENGQVKVEDLSENQRTAVGLGNASAAGRFLSWLDSCIGGGLDAATVERIRAAGTGEGGGGGEADQIEGGGGSAEE